MPKDEVTPSRQQYLDIKHEYPNTILFFRLGDFYETFDEDAEITSRELDIVLTSRPIGKGVRVPLAGIPYHAVDNYLARLIEKGYHVAICEQVGDTPVNGLVPRKVVRVVTPGTVTEPGLLPGDSNNYLASIILDASSSLSTGSKAASIAYADITTGEFAVTELPLEAIHAELMRLHPAEVLVPDNQTLNNGLQAHQTPYPAWKFEPGKCEETLLTHFNASTLEGFGIKGHSLAIRTAGVILQYLKETQPNALKLLTSLRSYSINEFMTLDASTRRNLELDETLRGERKGSLLGVLDRAVTPMGKRLMHQWVSQPLLNVSKIKQRQDGVQHFFDHGMKRAEIRNVLKPLADLERLVNRVMAGQAQPRDLVAMRDTLGQLPDVKEVMGNQASAISNQWSVCAEELSLLQSAIDDDPPSTLQNTGIIRAEYSQELDSVIDASKHARDWIANLEAVEREKTGLKTLKVGYNKVFGYYIEISRGAADKAPGHYIRKQTLVNAERFITPEMKEYETLVLNAEERIREIELRLFKEICAELSKSAFKLLDTARALAELDVLSALAEVAALGGYNRPEVHEGNGLEINEGRHPVVEQTLKGERYIPNDVIFEKGEIVRVITGPNMSGKCVTGDTLIWTDCGLLPIETLRPANIKKDEFSPMEIRVQSMGGLKQTSHFYFGGTQRTVRIVTRLGFILEGTPEHPVWVRQADETETWKPLGDIREGDILILKPGINLWGSTTCIGFNKPNKLTSLKSYPLPKQMNPDLAYIMGLLVGDGTLTYKNALTFTTGDSWAARKFSGYFKKQFNYRPQRKRNGQDISVSSRELRLFFAHLGLGYENALGKTIPHTILGAPKDCVIAFLQGLFDADGYADSRYGNVTLSTSSIRLARQVQAVLLNAGIVSGLHNKRTKVHTNYLVNISGENAIKFHKEIGFRLPRKRARAKLASGLRMPNVGGIPHLKKTLKAIQARIVAKKDKPFSLKSDKHINSIFYTYLPNGRNISRAKLRELISFCEKNGIEVPELKSIYENNNFYDPVARIMESKSEVYDLTVPDGHSFLANGFISHNSTYLRQTALIALMAQIGSFVPADFAQIGLVDRIFTRIGAQDEIHAGQSTFMVEMIEAANILHHATSRSLLILDEIGRGTSTYDGLSIAWGIIEFIHNHPHLRAKTLFATHYHELTQLAELLPGVRNYNVAVSEADNKVVFLHKIVPGGADKSYGIHVAQLAGLPSPVIQRANEIMAELEKSSGRAMRLNPHAAQQASLFPETSPLLDELKEVDVNSLSPIEALNKLFEWQRKYSRDNS